MTSTVWPLQKLCIIIPSSQNEQILLVASGPQVSAISLHDGRQVSQWPSQGDDNDNDDALVSETDARDENGTRPLKRRKLSSDQTDSTSRRSSDASIASVEIVAERKKGERRRPKKILDEKLPNVSHILATKDGKNVLIVTAENKTITVLELSSSLRLRAVSERCMPKRLCAVKLTDDEKTILAADKFGDVYALPLHPSSNYNNNNITKPPSEAQQHNFVPSATELTVHSKSNLNALRQQRELKRVTPRKEGPNFEHKILLGHVSLLTDLEIANGPVNGRIRPFIITADRDEHVRVSRGIPQAHIIEGYCLGHRDFTTKLCILPWAPEVLIVGNGEPSLRTFHWQTGHATQEYPLQHIIEKSLGISENQTTFGDGRSIDKLAVSGIWPVTLSSNDADDVSTKSLQTKGILLVALEGMPQLHTFMLDSGDDNQQLRHLHSQDLPGNVLDVTHIPDSRKILVSLDIVHQPGSMKTFRPISAITVDESLQSFELQIGNHNENNTVPGSIATMVWESVKSVVEHSAIRECYSSLTIDGDDGDAAAGSKRNAKEKDGEKVFSSLGEFLYGLENLRKKRGFAGGDDEGLEMAEANHA